MAEVDYIEWSGDGSADELYLVQDGYEGLDKPSKDALEGDDQHHADVGTRCLQC
jgi:hypothetical protein